MADLKINITATGGQASAEEIRKATAATGALADASKKNAAASKEAGTALDDFGKRGSAAKDAFEGVSMAANGGAGAIFGFSKAWVNLKEAFAANPVTAILGILLGVLGLVQKGFDLLVQRAEAARDKLYGTGVETKKTAESMAALEAATKAALQSAGKDAAQLEKTLATLNAGIDTSLDRLKLLESARDAAQISELEVNRQRELNAATDPGQADAINREFDSRVSAVKARSGETISRAEQQALLDKIITAVNTQSAAIDAIRQANEAIGTAPGPRERAAAQAVAEEVGRKNGPIASGAFDQITGLRTQLQARQLLDTAATNTGTAREIASLRATGRAIAPELGPLLSSAPLVRAPFNSSGYFSEETLAQGRRDYAAGGLGAANGLNLAKEKAANIAARIGDGQADDTDARELIATLDRIIRATDSQSANSLRDLVRRLANLEQAVKNARN